MGNYTEQARSNYFKVKDLEKFKSFLNKYYLLLIKQKGTELVGFIAQDGIPSWNKETDEELDFLDLLSKHLVKDEVAIIIGNGEEDMKYLTGFACAVNSKGKEKMISLYDIHEQAKKLTKTPDNITLAEY